MIPYAELAAALEGNAAPAQAAPSSAAMDDPTLSGAQQQDTSGEYEIGEEISEEG